MIARALTIAGSDPSGGAGIQADLKTFERFGVYGMSAVTLVTVQNTLGVSRVDVLDSELVAQQIHACVSDIGVDAIKTGALAAIALPPLPNVPLVVDPVLSSTSGMALSSLEALKALAPRATLLMPNLSEAEALVGTWGPEDTCQALFALGCGAVLLKGGHADGPSSDDLLYDGRDFLWLRAKRIDTKHTHGTGCIYSAAVTALLARGNSVRAAVTQAKAFITDAIENAPGLGHGKGPVR